MWPGRALKRHRLPISRLYLATRSQKGKRFGLSGGGAVYICTCVHGATAANSVRTTATETPTVRSLNGYWVTGGGGGGGGGDGGDGGGGEGGGGDVCRRWRLRGIALVDRVSCRRSIQLGGGLGSGGDGGGGDGGGSAAREQPNNPRVPTTLSQSAQSVRSKPPTCPRLVTLIAPVSEREF